MLWALRGVLLQRLAGRGARGVGSAASTHGTPLAGAAHPDPKTPPRFCPWGSRIVLRRQMGTRKGVGRQGRVSGFPSRQGGPCSDFPVCVKVLSLPHTEEGM